MNAAAEKEPVFGTDEGEGLNVGRKNEFLEGKMGQTKGNVGCPESESIASERDRLRTMEMAGQLECGEKCGKTATVEAGLGKVGLKATYGERQGRTAKWNASWGAGALSLPGKMSKKATRRRETGETRPKWNANRGAGGHPLPN